ncbi:SulP family inorganic anion transporter [Agromyces mariniharenae]|uniref:SulP family inorganic anion transporter n=1 Tax=Agromyces mariniharenae TaxID=2604423 RepID=A0A5S4V6H7_9MICO|nr:SulP family inorganic anion transporter [Agromyces mariniharenae]TYL53748.1 SulP family inorganic anion transporter [Agromyces mariniharenae]
MVGAPDEPEGTAAEPSTPSTPSAPPRESWVAARWRAIRGVFRRETLGKDAVAGTILGVESVPDGLAIGLLAGVNPVAGLYAFLFGMAGAALFTSSTFMAVNATSAMALIVADSDVGNAPDPDRALYTLAMLTGFIMVVAGLVGGGRLLRFVPTAVMVGFVTAVGINIVFGQLANLTGYTGRGANRLVRAMDTLLHLGQFHVPTLVVGLVTIGLIVVLTRTPLRALGLVVAIVLGSGLAALFTYAFDWEVLTVGDIADVPNALPAPVLPSLADVPDLLLPAFALAFVGLVQGAGVAGSVPNPDGRPADASRNFVGQGAGSIVAGVFRGMPVGGSTSASGILVAAGARTRLALFIASTVMAIVILVASGVVALVAMPALAGLLIVVGIQAIKPLRIHSVVKTGALQTTIMVVTFGLTLVVPLQFAVLIGVGLAIILFVAQQSNRLRVRQLEFHGEGRMRETDPVAVVPPHGVVVLQPYGNLAYATAPVFDEQLPKVDDASRGSVVIFRLRGIDELGLSLVAVLERYLDELEQRGSTLWLVVAGDRIRNQLAAGGLLDRLGPDRVYASSEWIGEAVHRAHADAEAWVAERR